MAKRKTTTHHTRARAKEVAMGGTSVRQRVRTLSVSAFRDRDLSLHDLSKLVHDVLAGAVEGVDASIPKARGNVLREVFDGLSEGVHALATAGSSAVDDVRQHGKAIADKAVPNATRRLRAANEEFLGAVKNFAGKTTKEARAELDALVARAKRTGPKVTDSARQAARAADGRLLELSDETARAGARVARRGADALAQGASGLLEGLSEAIAPKRRPKTRKHARKTAAAKPRKKPARKAARKKTRKKASSKRRKA